MMKFVDIDRGENSRTEEKIKEVLTAMAKSEEKGAGGAVHWLPLGCCLIFTSLPTSALRKVLALPPFRDTSRYPLLPMRASSPLPSA